MQEVPRSEVEQTPPRSEEEEQHDLHRGGRVVRPDVGQVVPPRRAEDALGVLLQPQGGLHDVDVRLREAGGRRGLLGGDAEDAAVLQVRFAISFSHFPHFTFERF